MRLKDYPKNQLEAAMAAKRLNYLKLAQLLCRSTTSVHKAINGASTIKSIKLEREILSVLQPELDLISSVLGGRDGSETI